MHHWVPCLFLLLFSFCRKLSNTWGTTSPLPFSLSFKILKLYSRRHGLRYPPDVPLYRRFEKEDEEEGVFDVRSLSAADYRNDPVCKYTEDVLEYLDTLREYTREVGICATKPPIAADVSRGFVEVQPCHKCWRPSPAFSIKDLMDETCPVCQEELKDENEVITTYCSHVFHTRCLLPWLSKKNTCPTCRAVYPLHYSPFLDRLRRKRKHGG
ncbi:hypothetical protein HAX54_043149 [Datura stramonium]|uniref:RING-type domain-containing protein n=1 Tax=Datura stramonium TaxID=4076 RepID=A0ABS8SNA9_DATST|nr:hypothetical protein [Datura stramonium]